MHRLLTFERRGQPLASNRLFYHTSVAYWSRCLAFVALSLVVGSAGYMYFESMSLIDAFSMPR